MTDTKDINVETITRFLPEQSDCDRQQYAFAYTITISNSGDEPVQLLSRH